MNRYFTIAEANAQVPYLTDILSKVMRLRTQMKGLYRRLEARGFAPDKDDFTPEVKGAPADVVRDRTVFKSLLELIKQDLAEVHALGCHVKDIEIGLCDWFTRTRDGDVLLCWKLGEKEVGFWHDLRSGFAGRRPISELPPLDLPSRKPTLH